MHAQSLVCTLPTLPVPTSGVNRRRTSLNLHAPQMLPESDPLIKKEVVVASLVAFITIAAFTIATSGDPAILRTARAMLGSRHVQDGRATKRSGTECPRLKTPQPLRVSSDFSARNIAASQCEVSHDVSRVFPCLRATRR